MARGGRGARHPLFSSHQGRRRMMLIGVTIFGLASFSLGTGRRRDEADATTGRPAAGEASPPAA